jgi:hypothetical protein
MKKKTATASVTGKKSSRIRNLEFPVVGIGQPENDKKGVRPGGIADFHIPSKCR